MTKQCNWSENKLINGKLVTVNCESINTVKDKDNVNNRWFCNEHMQEVKKTRKIMHKNCVSKERLIQYLNIYYQNMENENGYHFMEFKNEQDKYTHYGILLAINTIKEKIKNGEFDNE